MLQPKDTNWLNGYKNETLIYAVYKKPSSDLKIHIDWKWEDGKIYSMHMWSKRKLELIAILISDKIDLKEDYKRKGRTLHNDQGINPRGRHNNCKYLCTQHRITLIPKTNTYIKGEIDSNTVIVGDFNTPLTPMDRSSKQTINKETQV